MNDERELSEGMEYEGRSRRLFDYDPDLWLEDWREKDKADKKKEDAE